jgi:hypothetical protein
VEERPPVAGTAPKRRPARRARRRQTSPACAGAGAASASGPVAGAARGGSARLAGAGGSATAPAARGARQSTPDKRTRRTPVTPGARATLAGDAGERAAVQFSLALARRPSKLTKDFVVRDVRASMGGENLKVARRSE